MPFIKLICKAIIASIFVFGAVIINATNTATPKPIATTVDNTTTPESHFPLFKRWNYAWIGSHIGKFPCEGLQDPKRPKIKKVNESTPPSTPDRPLYAR